jgi:PHD/YefM family antitoxin component YafN of YafNO toxin-antitoxin module
MSDRPETIEVETLGAGVRELMSRLQATGRPLLLVDRGEPSAVLLSPAELRRLLDERELLRRLALGELESAAGQGSLLEEVLEACDRLVEES